VGAVPYVVAIIELDDCKEEMEPSRASPAL